MCSLCGLYVCVLQGAAVCIFLHVLCIVSDSLDICIATIQRSHCDDISLSCFEFVSARPVDIWLLCLQVSLNYCCSDAFWLLLILSIVTALHIVCVVLGSVEIPLMGQKQLLEIEPKHLKFL